MTTHQNVVKSCLLHQVFFNFVSVRSRTWSTFEGILFWALKSWLESECTVKTFYFFRLRIIIARTQVLESNWFYVQRIENISSFSYVVVGFSKSTFICQLFFIEWRESFIVVMHIRARLIGLLRSIKYFSLWEAEAPSLFELCIFLLENILECVVRSRWPCRLARWLKPVSLWKTNWHKRIPHCVCRLFLTHKAEKLRSILNHWESKISYSGSKLILFKTSSRHELCWIRLIYRPRVSLFEISDASSNLVIQFSICALRCMALQ